MREGLPALGDLGEGAATFLKQYTHDVYSSVSDQLKRQAASALPDIALQYLQVHAQRGQQAERVVRFDPSQDWLQLEDVDIEAEVDEEGWALLSADHERLARSALGLTRRKSALEAGGALVRGGVRVGLLTVPKVLGGAAVQVGLAAGGAALCLVAPRPRPPFPSIGVPPWDRFEEESVRCGQQDWYFRAWLPFESSLEGPPPLILLLHGYRECGWDNYWQCSSGLGTLLQDWDFAERFPAVVLLPQLPRKPWDVKWWQGWKEPKVQEAVMAMLWHTVRKYGCDGRRIYVVGESLGGEGAWQLARRFPRVFAGVAAACGSLDPYDWNSWQWGEESAAYEEVARGAQAPFWFCHGSEDPYVPLSHPRKLEAALRQERESWSWSGLPRRLLGLQSRKEVVFKTYEGLGHEVWTRAYQEDDLLDWILQQRL